MPEVLFLCTGNYYRSRYAALVFDHLARARGSRWRARSRGLALSPANEGPISPFVGEALAPEGIPLPTPVPDPVALSAEDLAEATHVVALKRTEHEPLLRAAFPEALGRVEFWEVHDVDRASPAEALPGLRHQVEELLGRLESPRPPSEAPTEL